MAFLVDNQNDLRGAGVPVSINLSLEPFLPELDSTWSELFPLFLGRDFTEQLAAAWVSDDGFSAVQKALQVYLMRPVCQIAFGNYLPFAEVQIMDDGITTSADPNRKPASERQIIGIRQALFESGWKHLENLLAYLDHHQDDFPLYAEFVADQEPMLLPTAREFSQYHPIGGSRLTFQALLPTINQLLNDSIVPLLGDRWPAILDSTEKADEQLLRQLRVWLAKKTVVEAVPGLAIELAGNSLKVHYTSNINNIAYTTAPTEAQLDRLITKCEQQAQSAWQTALEVLNGNPDDAGRGLFDNTDAKVFFC